MHKTEDRFYADTTYAELLKKWDADYLIPDNRGRLQDHEK